MEKVTELNPHTEQASAEAVISVAPKATDTPPFIDIQYAETIKFKQPVTPTYSRQESIHSALSLLFMSIMAMLMYAQLKDPSSMADSTLWNMFLGLLGLSPNVASLPTWVWLPFALTIFGAAVGCAFETGLIVKGTPFQQQQSPLTRFISKIRFLNLAPLASSLFFFICAIAIQSPSLRAASLIVAAALAGAYGFGLFFGTKSPLLPMSMLGLQLIQVAIVLASNNPIVTTTVAVLLIGQSLLQFTSLIIGTATPKKSTLFHVISTFSGVLLFAAFMKVNAQAPSFAAMVAPTLNAGTLLFWGMLVAGVVGLIATIKLLPDSYNAFREGLSNSIWTPIYFKLISAERFPDPVNLSEIYDRTPPQKTHLKPYYQAHPEHLIKNLSIPAVGDNHLERNVTVFKKLLKQAESAFKLITWLDHNVPQANLNEPLKNKPRLAIWSNGSEYWPKFFHKTVFGSTMPNHGDLRPAPQQAIVQYKNGQLLAYLAESGVANTFLKRDPTRTDDTLMIDFRFLEKYETKSDYEPYGGVAYFTINAESESLQLHSVQGPNSHQVLAANPHDPQFRRAERLIIASMYYAVISGKHLAEIHMTYNLVEVCMHNAFDAQNQWRHPFRTFMYLHFFSHELAEEITTEHLIQEGAVFSQIFATTHNGMINHLNDTYAQFEYGADENFEERVALMTLPNGKTLPKACINWELEYVNIWEKYVNQIIDVIYETDQHVQEDTFLQDFHKGLNEVLTKGLPKRYAHFKTKHGVARFAVDTIHHMVVRHQVYGTTGIRAALDPRISSTQIPKDSGTPGVDEWRSLAYVAQATGEARFTLLTGNRGKDFTYLLKGVEEQYRESMALAFDRLQKELQMLDNRWTQDDIEKSFNYDYFRAIPSDVHTGPGY